VNYNWTDIWGKFWDMRNADNVMTTLRSDEERTGFRFVVDQCYFSSPHCPESPWLHADVCRKWTGLFPKGDGIHSERVQGSFRKENTKKTSGWSFTILQKKGEGFVVFRHISRTASCPRWLSRHSSVFANTSRSCNNIYPEESKKSRGGTFSPIVPNRKNT
jgi:hypothetical protein